MRKVASNIVYLNNIEFYKNHIVELYEHIVINHYNLADEQEKTEWFNGTIIIHEQKAYIIRRILAQEEVEKIYMALSSSPELSTDNCCCYGNIERL